jgi:hypothetical protein
MTCRITFLGVNYVAQDQQGQTKDPIQAQNISPLRNRFEMEVANEISADINRLRQERAQHLQQNGNQS